MVRIAPRDVERFFRGERSAAGPEQVTRIREVLQRLTDKPRTVTLDCVMRGEDGMVRTVRHLLLIDLDGLKKINDTFGHERGDRAIKGIAEELRGHFRDTDIIGRVGGVEFMAYLRGAAPRIETIEASIQKLLCKLGERFIGPNDERHISCSIGGAVPYDRAENFETLFARADAALYHVKRGGKSDFAFYSPEMTL